MQPSRPRPLLLASVADAGEATVALEAGADVLDIKNPREGSLGACPPATVRAIVALRDARATRDASGPVAVSAALGDAPDLPGTLALAAAGAAACGVDYLKVGLRGVRREDDAVRLLRAIVRAAREVAPGAGVVAAAYADAAEIGSLPPGALPPVAARAGAAGCLVDTLRKDGRTLFDHLRREDLRRFVSDCRRRGLLCALAGSLSPVHLPILVEIAPDLIGARGALCEGGREGRLDPGRLRAFREALRAQPASVAAAGARRPAPRRAASRISSPGF
jgi:uncharacterized protein (UPF0264 family)